MGTARLTIRAGEDWEQPVLYEVNGQLTAVQHPHVQIRALPHLPPVLDLTENDITQDTPGQLRLHADAATTAALRPALGYLWDLYGTIDGRRVKLVDTSPADILPATTHD